MLTMRSYCSLITPPLPRIFLICAIKDRGETTENSCNNIFNVVEWDWEPWRRWPEVEPQQDEGEPVLLGSNMKTLMMLVIIMLLILIINMLLILIIIMLLMLMVLFAWCWWGILMPWGGKPSNTILRSDIITLQRSIWQLFLQARNPVLSYPMLPSNSDLFCFGLTNIFFQFLT